jgi:hypothetical protein
MSERKDNPPSGEPSRVLRCDEWESLMADALDGTLSPADAAAFTRHQGECALCSQMLKETQQGMAWMEYLVEPPPVPDGLMEKILARTSERLQPGVAAGVAAPLRPQPARSAWYRRPMPVLVPVLRQVFEPRLLMTAAMAFFSIALTLNLTGIKLTQVHAADLRPARLKATLTRQYYSTNEQVMKYYENLRVVYEMEARVRELRRASEQEPAPAQAPRENPKPPARDGSPRSTVPSLRPLPVPQDKHSAAEQVSASFDPSQGTEKVRWEVFRALPAATEDQARRSLV